MVFNTTIYATRNIGGPPYEPLSSDTGAHTHTSPRRMLTAAATRKFERRVTNSEQPPDNHAHDYYRRRPMARGTPRHTTCALLPDDHAHDIN